MVANLKRKKFPPGPGFGVGSPMVHLGSANESAPARRGAGELCSLN